MSLRESGDDLLSQAHFILLVAVCQRLFGAGVVKGTRWAIILRETRVMDDRLDRSVAKVEEYLTNTDETTANPVLIMLSGLPGTGKSCLAQSLVEILPFVIIESDQVRKLLFSKPRYTPEESYWVHRTCHALMAKLLRKGVRVIYDATNLHERHRELVYRLADKEGVKLLVVKAVAPEGVASERLRGRHEESEDDRDVSDADWRVYERMARRAEPIGRNHVVVDTSQDLKPAVTKLLRLIRG
jgi:predicted kinase